MDSADAGPSAGPSPTGTGALLAPMAVCMVLLYTLKYLVAGRYSIEKETKGKENKKKKNGKKYTSKSKRDLGTVFVQRRPDFETLWEKGSRFRGWYTLVMCFTVVYIFTNTFKLLATKGAMFSQLRYMQTVAAQFPVTLVFLGIMYLLSFLGYVNQKIMIYFDLGVTGRAVMAGVQHTIQASMILSSCVTVYYYGDDMAISSKLFVMIQTMVFYMKMHSYMMTNHMLWEAMNNKKNEDYSGDSTCPEGELADLDQKTVVRHLRRCGLKQTDLEGYHVEELRTMLDYCLRAKNYRTIAYPNNVSYLNWLRFSWMPTMVYEPMYPSTDCISPRYIVEKFVISWVLIWMDWLIMERYLAPVLTRVHELEPYDAVFEIMIPLFCLVLLTFYLVFNCICLAVCELTRLADRKLYQDWWNSTTFEEFARKWNRPVHEFLLRHIYLHAMKKYGFSRNLAMTGTFIFSIVLHEVCISACIGMVRPYLAAFSLLQLPLRPLMQSPLFKGSIVGNIIFWLGLMFGMALILVLYARDYCGVGNCVLH